MEGKVRREEGVGMEVRVAKYGRERREREERVRMDGREGREEMITLEREVGKG